MHFLLEPLCYQTNGQTLDNRYKIDIEYLYAIVFIIRIISICLIDIYRNLKTIINMYVYFL